MRMSLARSSSSASFAFDEMTMLPSGQIPQYEDEDHPEDWRRFLEKAAKGSYKAVEMLRAAHMAYMVTLTGDAQALDEMPLDQYDTLFRERFPSKAPAKTAQELFDLAFHCGYFSHKLSLTVGPRLPAHAYRNIWARRILVPG